MSDLAYRPPQEPLTGTNALQLYPQDMTATAGASVTLEQLDRELAAAGQWLPIDGEGRAALGDLVETNSTGPLRLGYGAWRDLLLGVQFRNGRGELVSAGGRTVKNVAGYDLTKFMVGQRGVFGRLVTITTRTYRRPAAALHVRFAAGARRIGDLIPTEARPQWAIRTPEALVCGYLGDERTMDYIRRNLARWEPQQVDGPASLEEDQRLRAALWLGDGRGEARLRASVPPARLEEFARQAGLTDWCADPAFGLVRSWQAHDAGRIAQAAREVQGSAMLDGKLLSDLAADPALHSLLQRLKAAFDPEKTLNPLP